MSAAVIPFRAKPCRAWLIRETAPGVWVGELFDAPSGYQVERVRPGPEWRVQMAVHDWRLGLPIIRMPLAGRAA